MRSLFVIVFIAANFCFLKSAGQGAGAGTVNNNEFVSIPTPQAAELGRYNQVPVDLFNGLANVSIPVYQFPVKGTNVKISLSYHAGGVKPNVKGGWTGLGWSLNATGTITRIQNGMLDENVSDYIPAPNDKNGYYWKQTTLDRADWDSPEALYNFLSRVVCVGAYGDGNSSTDPNNPGCGDINTPLTDWAPDEFLFSFFGYSGSFWLDHHGNWIARENSGEKFTVELIGEVGTYNYVYPTFLESGVTNSTKQALNMFQGFVLTDGNGNKFTFGNDANNIELTRSSIDPAHLKATATTWYLKQIQTHLNETVDFAYERKYPTLALNSSIHSYTSSYEDDNDQTYTTFDHDVQVLGGVVQDPVYLTAISSNDFLVTINYKEAPSISGHVISQYSSKELSDGKIKTNYNIDAQYYKGADVGTGGPNTAVDPKDFIIDNIRIANGTRFKNLKFSYYGEDGSDQGTNRVLLKEVLDGPLQLAKRYQFEYYGTSFDTYISSDNLNKFYTGYLTYKTDHWGFFNNKFPIDINLLPVVLGTYQTNSHSEFPSQTFLDDYYANRATDANEITACSLKKIIYPTGGYTEFTYEPNSYSKKISLTSTNTVSAGGNLIGGGLRIKETKQYTEAGATPFVKHYSYVNTDGTSSGILNSKGITYLDSRSGSLIYNTISHPFSYKFFYDASQFPLLNTNGNYVTYSRVEETLENGSKNIYLFSNHEDSRFVDVLPYAGIFTTDNAPYYLQTNSRQYSRSMALNQSSYKVNETTPMQSEEQQYENDESIVASKNGIRTYSLKQKDIILTNFHRAGQLVTSGTFRKANIWEPNITANMYYIHPYRPIQKILTETESGTSLTQTETYTYNSFNNKLKELTRSNLSDHTSKETKYYYPNDFAGTQVYDAMIGPDINIVDPIVKEENYKITNGTSLLLTTSKTNYYGWPNSLYLPLTNQSSRLSNTLEDDVTFNAYDSRGNILQYTKRNGIVTTYLWGYKKNLPILKVIGATYQQVMNAFTTLSGTTIDSKYESLQNITNETTLKSKLDEVRQSFATSKAVQVYSYTYDQMSGISSITDLNGKTISYKYDNLFRLSQILDQDGYILKTFEYKFKDQ